MSTSRVVDPIVSADSEIPILTENAVRVLKNRYLIRTEERITETPRQLFERVARHISKCEVDEETREHWSTVFYDLMTSGRFMPNSPTLMNSGRRLGLLSACFVLPVPDDTEGIFRAIRDTAMIQKAGGGTGFAFDELRPCGAFVSSSGGVSSGPISFWRVFSEATSAIQQGSFRRGANMAIMRIDHPDIIKFLFAKQDLQQFTNFNISIKVDDGFMKDVSEHPDTPFVVVWPDKDGKGWFVPKEIVERCRITVEKGATGEIQPRVLDTCYGLQDLVPVSPELDGYDDFLTVKGMFDIIVNNAWATGEPGLFFIDRVRETEATSEIAFIQATNPCGEQPLMPNESCNLGSLNLGAFVRPFYEDVGPSSRLNLNNEMREILVDWDGLRAGIRHSLRFLDNVVSINKYPTEAITKICSENRKVGLGVMGFADALIRLGVRYDSDDGLRWGERFMKFVNDEALAASRELAEERGAFKNFEQSTWRSGPPMRNACVTSVAPTGTISILANASCGIEPLFSWVFKRQILGGEVMLECQKDFAALGKIWGFDSDELRAHIFEHGTLQNADVPDVVKEIFRSAHDISPEWHIRMQAAFQQHTTSSISKTINLPHEAEPSDVRYAYTFAHQCNCKGVTVYRDGCREKQPMIIGTSIRAKKVSVVPEVPHFRDPVSVPEFMHAMRTRYSSAWGNLHMSISLEMMPDGRYREREVFFNLGRSGDGVNPMTESFGRLSSMILRLGGGLPLIIDQLRGHVLGSHHNNGSGKATSPPHELALGMMEYYKRTAAFRDDEGFLTQIPSLQVTPVGNSGGNDSVNSERSQAFIRRVTTAVATVGMYRVPCPTPGCVGELIYVEGCQKCLTCGEGSCS